VDSYGRLSDCVPAAVEVKRLAGRMVWLREEEHEWIGPAEEALALLDAADPDGSFWAALAPVTRRRPKS
jgi:hypothetical protein